MLAGLGDLSESFEHFLFAEDALLADGARWLAPIPADLSGTTGTGGLPFGESSRECILSFALVVNY